MVELVHGLVFVPCAHYVLFERLKVFLALFDLHAEHLVLI